MATIKSYTSVEQSRKLAEILPLESADMFLAMNGMLPVMSKYIDDGLVPADETAIPCWSLAALLGVIPQEIFDGECIINITEGIDNRWVITYDYYENRNRSYYGLSSGAYNLVDACVAIIKELHERKML